MSDNDRRPWPPSHEEGFNDGVEWRFSAWASVTTIAPSMVLKLPPRTREEVQAARLARRLERASRRPRQQ